MTGALSLSFFTNPHESQATQRSLNPFTPQPFAYSLKKFGNDLQVGEPDEDRQNSTTVLLNLCLNVRIKKFNGSCSTHDCMMNINTVARVLGAVSI